MFSFPSYQPIELASDQERYEMERKKHETTTFFKEMEKNIFHTFEKAKKKEEADDSMFTDFNSDGMYEFNDDYDDNMDDMLRNSVNIYRDGKECNVGVFSLIQ